MSKKQEQLRVVYYEEKDSNTFLITRNADTNITIFIKG